MLHSVKIKINKLKFEILLNLSRGLSKIKLVEHVFEMLDHHNVQFIKNKMFVLDSFDIKLSIQLP